ncbi:hypothetical protein ACIP1U_16020 [Cupriavidus sp. NPDC089707]|uniref:hypothetical protein n=1 Tax=Cupriavidus sp. NPDC089707 TaxID=3363963 RepID=UPI003825E443
MPAKLIRFIELHDGNTAVDNGDGTLTVTYVALMAGIAYDKRETIPATATAVRDVLGY